MPANWHLKKEVTLGIIWSVLGGLAIGLVFVAKLWADVQSNTKAVVAAEKTVERTQQLEIAVSSIQTDMNNVKQDTREIKAMLHELLRRELDK